MYQTDNTWVTLWLVTFVILANYNVTYVQRNKKILWERKKKHTCDIVVGQCHNVTNHNVTQVLPLYKHIKNFIPFFFNKNYFHQSMVLPKSDLKMLLCLEHNWWHGGAVVCGAEMGEKKGINLSWNLVYREI